MPFVDSDHWFGNFLDNDQGLPLEIFAPNIVLYACFKIDFKYPYPNLTNVTKVSGRFRFKGTFLSKFEGIFDSRALFTYKFEGTFP